jgi:hypothetical protein
VEKLAKKVRRLEFEVDSLTQELTVTRTENASLKRIIRKLESGKGQKQKKEFILPPPLEDYDEDSEPVAWGATRAPVEERTREVGKKTVLPQFVTISGTDGVYYIDLNLFQNREYGIFFSNCDNDTIELARSNVYMWNLDEKDIYSIDQFFANLILVGFVRVLVEIPTGVSEEEEERIANDEFDRSIEYIRGETPVGLTMPDIEVSTGERENRRMIFTVRVVKGTKGFDLIDQAIFARKRREKPLGHVVKNWGFNHDVKIIPNTVFDDE